MVRERVYHADVIRIFACLLVVLMHSPMPGPKLIPFFTSGLTYFSMPCIGLFLTLSGYLLLPVKTAPSDSFNFAWSRVKKFLMPLIIWSLIYLMVDGVFFSGNFQVVIRHLLSLPFYPQEGVLWYMYVLIGLYFVAPVITPWLVQANEKTIRIYLMIWGISLLVTYISPFVDVREGTSGILYYFSGYLGYFILGYYIKTFNINIRPIIALSVIIILMAFYAIFRIFEDNLTIKFGEVFWYLSVDSPILVIMWWNLLKPISEKINLGSSRLKNFIVELSNLSFGVYLSHILVMRHCLWNWNLIQSIDNYFVQTIIVFVLSVLGSLLLVYLLSLSSFGKFIIAYTKR